MINVFEYGKLNSSRRLIDTEGWTKPCSDSFSGRYIHRSSILDSVSSDAISKIYGGIELRRLS